MNEVTRALFEAHVAHEVASLAGPGGADRFDHFSERLFEWLSTVTLDHLLTREQVLGVIDRYVIELRISGGIAELVGQLAQAMFTSEAGAATRVDQLLSYEGYRGFADKVQSLEAAFRELLQLITRTRSFQPLLARALVLSLRALVERDGDGARTSKLAQLSRDLKDELALRLEDLLQRYIERHADELARISELRMLELLDLETVRSVADELWDVVGCMRLSQLYSLLSPTDMEDFVVLGYENWLSYRQTPYFRAICEQVVDVFFGKYGSESAQSFLDDMGVTPSMVAHELRVLVGPFLSAAASSGFAEQQVRARLEPFYRSDAVRSLLERPARTGE